MIKLLVNILRGDDLESFVGLLDSKISQESLAEVEKDDTNPICWLLEEILEMQDVIHFFVNFLGRFLGGYRKTEQDIALPGVYIEYIGVLPQGDKYC